MDAQWEREWERACLPVIKEEPALTNESWQLVFLRKWLRLKREENSNARAVKFFRRHCQGLSSVSRRVLAGNMWRDRYCNESKSDRQQSMLEVIYRYHSRHDGVAVADFEQRQGGGL